MSILLCTGYIIIQLFDMERGYWILLTSLFVCQPNYSATKRRLALRIIGTIVGILIGLPLLNLIPSMEGQLTLIVISGLLFLCFAVVNMPKQHYLSHFSFCFVLTYWAKGLMLHFHGSLTH